MHHLSRSVTLALTLSLTATSPSLGGLATETDALARRLLNAQGCKACHALEGKGGTAAASFETIATQTATTRIRLALAGGDGRHGDGRIPDYAHLAPEELSALTAFIKNLDSGSR